MGAAQRLPSGCPHPWWQTNRPWQRPRHPPKCCRLQASSTMSMQNGHVEWRSLTCCWPGMPGEVASACRAPPCCCAPPAARNAPPRSRTCSSAASWPPTCVAGGVVCVPGLLQEGVVALLGLPCVRGGVCGWGVWIPLTSPHLPSRPPPPSPSNNSCCRQAAPGPSPLVSCQYLSAARWASFQVHLESWPSACQGRGEESSHRKVATRAAGEHAPLSRCRCASRPGRCLMHAPAQTP